MQILASWFIAQAMHASVSRVCDFDVKDGNASRELAARAQRLNIVFLMGMLALKTWLVRIKALDYVHTLCRVFISLIEAR